jgi:nucleotide-binding universal stress UspA family protein
LAFSTLLACMRFDRPNAALLSVVSDTAERFGSFVIGLVAKQASAHVPSSVAGPFEPPEHDLQAFMEHASAAETEFRTSLSKVGKLEWRPQLTFGPVSEHIANEARSADLVVAPIDDRDESLFSSGQMHLCDLLLRLGRPVLAVPSGASGLELNEVLVCWKDSREARRAVADALPMLQVSKRVDVVEIVEAGGVDQSRRRLDSVGDWLARNGVESHCSAEVSTGAEARQLAAIARDLGVNLIVAGAFGHSRLRERAFGGVTKNLLLGADCCVLASH